MIKKDDMVMVISGKEKGKSGKVLKVIPKKNRALVEKVDIIKRHSRPSPKAPRGGIVEKEGSLHLSNLMIICSKCSRPTRIGKKVLGEEGERVRICKRCGEIL